MTQPSWVSVSEITDASLGWFAVDSTNQRHFEMTRPADQTNEMKSRCDILGIKKLWGPLRIPEWPKEPPKLRRFIGKKGGYEISGVVAEDSSDVRYYWFSDSGHLGAGLTNITRIEDVKFLDN